MDEKRIRCFKKKTEKTFCVLYKIEEIANKENTDLKISNAIIEDISMIKREKEVLIFPFSCFEIINIKEIKANGVDYEFHLKYLGNYSEYEKDQFGPDFFDNIQITNFSQELIESGIVQIDNLLSEWEKKEEIKVKLDKICFMLDDQENCISFSNTLLKVTI